MPPGVDAPRPIRAPDLHAFGNDAAHIAMTVSCTDSDQLPRVHDAGDFTTVGGRDVQVMHNGVLVERDAYVGTWMTEIIRCLRGFHEPQEELVFARTLERLATTDESPTMIELGSWWAYYSLWFRRVFPRSRIVAVEPDTEHLAITERHFALNHETADFVHGGIASGNEQTFSMEYESDSEVHDVPRYTLGELLSAQQLDRVSVVLADIQGAETALVEDAMDLLSGGAVRFLFISTHHFTISRDALTHQRVLKAVRSAGGHVIAEHSVGESFSGDGLVAVSFDPKDTDFTVDITRARQRDSQFGELEVPLAKAFARVVAAEEKAATVTRWNLNLVRRITELEALLDEETHPGE